MIRFVNFSSDEEYLVSDNRVQVVEWDRVKIISERPISSVQLIGDRKTQDLKKMQSDKDVWIFQAWTPGTYTIAFESDKERKVFGVEALPSVFGSKPGGRSLSPFDVLLREIADLAVDLQSLAINRGWLNVGVHLGSEAGGVIQSVASDSWIDLRQRVNRVVGLWALIEQCPCKDVIRVKSVGRADRARTHSARRQIAIKPFLRFVEDMVMIESLNTSEHKWLLQQLLVLRQGVSVELRKLEPRSLLDDVDDLITIEKRKNEIESWSNALRKVDSILKSKLLSGLTSDVHIQHPSNRLMSRPGYSELHRVLQLEPESEPLIAELERLRDLQRQQVRNGIKKSSELYEIWCFLKIYFGLRCLGFEPVGNQPQECLYLSEDSLSLSKQKYVLKKEVLRGEIEIEIAYDCEIMSSSGLEKKRPDILLRIRAPRRRYGVEELLVILDAKYHDYNRLGGKISSSLFSFRHDVEKVALEKYFETLGAGVSFILHPCRGYEWRGEEPYSEFLGNTALQLPRNEVLEMPNHRVGALVLHPDLSSGIMRLFALVFHHRLGYTSLCLACGRELSEARQFRKNSSEGDFSDVERTDFDGYGWDPTDPSTKFRAVCDCGHSWRVSFCNGPHSEGKGPSANNRLVTPGRLPQKMNENGSDSFIGIHKYSNGQAHCPICGKIGSGSNRALSTEFSASVTGNVVKMLAPSSGSDLNHGDDDINPLSD